MSQPANLEQMLNRMTEAESDRGEVTVDAIVSELGHRSFAPMLLLAGLITISPVGGIPGVPTLMGLLVLLVSVQLLAKKSCFWLPNWLLARSVPRDKLDKSCRWLQKPARFIDRFLHPRLTFLTGDTGNFVSAIVSVLIALMMPPLELIPFSVFGAGFALTLFGLALLANDGLIVIIGLVVTVSTFVLALMALL